MDDKDISVKLRKRRSFTLARLASSPLEKLSPPVDMTAHFTVRLCAIFCGISLKFNVKIECSLKMCKKAYPWKYYRNRV